MQNDKLSRTDIIEALAITDELEYDPELQRDYLRTFTPEQFLQLDNYLNKELGKRFGLPMKSVARLPLNENTVDSPKYRKVWERCREVRSVCHIRVDGTRIGLHGPLKVRFREPDKATYNHVSERNSSKGSTSGHKIITDGIRTIQCWPNGDVEISQPLRITRTSEFWHIYSLPDATIDFLDLIFPRQYFLPQYKWCRFPFYYPNSKTLNYELVIGDRSDPGHVEVHVGKGHLHKINSAPPNLRRKILRDEIGKIAAYTLDWIDRLESLSVTRFAT